MKKIMLWLNFIQILNPITHSSILLLHFNAFPLTKLEKRGVYSEIFLPLEFGGGWGGLYSSSFKSLEGSMRRIYPCLMDFCAQFFAEVWSVLALQEIGQVLAPIIKSFYDITKCVSSNQKAATQIVSSMKSFHELFKHCWSDAFLQAFERYWLFSKFFNPF